MSKLELRDDGIPEEYMTRVLVPTLLGSLHGVEEGAGAPGSGSISPIEIRICNSRFSVTSRIRPPSPGWR